MPCYSMNRNDDMLLAKILRYCDEIEATHMFFHNDESLFCDQSNGFIYRNAITMAILQIGELAKALSDECCHSYPDIPWKQVIRTRDVYAHHYGAIEYEQVWKTSTEDIDLMKSILLKAKKEEA